MSLAMIDKQSDTQTHRQTENKESKKDSTILTRGIRPSKPQRLCRSCLKPSGVGLARMLRTKGHSRTGMQGRLFAQSGRDVGNTVKEEVGRRVR